MSTVTLLAGDAIEVLKTLPEKSVHACICSPPFYGLRDYGTAIWEGGDPDCDHTIGQNDRDNKAASKISSRVSRGKRDACLKCGAIRIDKQIGLEASPEDYVARLVEVFREVRRVLRDDGTLWLNLGSSYASRGGPEPAQSKWSVDGASNTQNSGNSRVAPSRFKPKDMIPIPWMVAMALQADGWWLRSDLIWAKSNAMCESVKDRLTTSHEYIFLLAKSRKYFYDNIAIMEPATTNLENRTLPRGSQGYAAASAGVHGSMQRGNINGYGYSGEGLRNKRSVWKIATKPYKGAHFAVFPEALVEPCLLASTSAMGCCPACGAPWKRITKKENPPHDGNTDSAYAKGTTANRLAILRQAARARGEEYTDRTITVGWQPSCKCDGSLEPVPCTVIDIFMGSGTTGAVAVKHGRNFVGIDLNSSYLTLAEERIAKVQPLLFLEAT